MKNGSAKCTEKAGLRTPDSGFSEGCSRQVCRWEAHVLFCYYPSMVIHPIVRFLVFWGVNTLSLWVADALFDGISFETPQSLFIAGLILGIVNTFLKPVLVILTLPLSIVTLGLFVLVINALMLLLVAWLVPGFLVAGFWSGFLVALFVAIFSFIVNSLIGFNKARVRRIE